MRRSVLGAALAATMALSSFARATTFSTDASDLWFNPQESGWGVNVIQQGDILFATLFVYTPGGAPIWYVGSAVQYTGASGGSLNYSGQLFRTTGQWFGGAFNPNAVTATPVGNVSFSFDTVETGTLTYSVDGVSVSKRITRQTWRINQIAGSFIGAAIGTYAGCPSGSNGYAEETGIVNVTQSGSAATLQLALPGNTCTYSGTFSQAGRMGSMSGRMSCTNGTSGTFQAFEIEASISGFTARAQVQLGGSCQWSGRIGGLKRGT